MTRVKLKPNRAVLGCGPNPIPPEGFFLRPSEKVIEYSGPPLSEEERFRERMAAARERRRGFGKTSTSGCGRCSGR
jgi:hypothetical protein